MRSPRKKIKQRPPKAFSLVTVLCSGMIGAMWIAAAYAMLVPLIEQSSAGKQSNMMRILAEAAVDYVSNDISTCLATSQISKLDDPDVGAPYNTFDLTAAQIGIGDNSNGNVRLSVIVKNDYPTSVQDSVLYDFQTVPTDLGIDSKKQWSVVKSQNVSWRIIEVHVSVGSSKAVYRAIMRPDYGSVLYTGSGSDPGNPPSSFFPANQAAFSTTALSVGSNTTVTGSLGTNGSNFGSAALTISGNTIAINGDVSVNSLKAGSDDLVAQGGSTSGGTQPVIKGHVTANGTVNGFDDAAVPDPSSVSVQKPTSGDTSPLITPKGSSTQTAVAPAPIAPNTATDLGAINLSGDAKLVIQDGPATIPAGQSLANMTSGTATIPPGDYKISSMNVSDTASIQMSDPGSISQPASFYVNDLSTGNAAVSIGGKGITNSTSGNFQIWYNGSDPVNITGLNATMAVYAPNAKVTVSGQSAANTFKGAVLGSNVSISNSNITFETPTAQTTNAKASGQLMYATENGSALIQPHALRKVLWQELSYGDYLKQGNTPF